MRTIISLVFLFFATFTFGQSNEKYEAIKDSLFAKAQYEEAIKYFEGEFKKYPENEKVLRILGFAHLAKNNLDLAEDYYQKAFLVNPQCARCFLNIGKAYSFKGDNQKALEYFNNAVNTDDQDANLYSDRAKLKEMMSDYAGALTDHNSAVAIDALNSDLYIQRGLFHSRVGQHDMGIKDLTKAIEMSPDDYKPYFQRSSMYYNQKNLEHAMKDVNKAIELDPTQSELFTGRGTLLNSMQEYKKAIQDFTKAISLNKEHFLPYLNRATSYYQLENLDASCEDILMIKAQIDKGDFDDPAIMKEVNDAVKDHCDATRPSYYYQRGIGFYNLKEFDKALDMYTKGLQKFPNNAMMLSFKGNAHMSLQQFEEAITYYEESLKQKANILNEIRINPRFENASEQKITLFYKASIANTHFNIAECKVNLEKYDEAFTHINTALGLVPEDEEFNVEAYYNLRGHIYLVQENFEKAIFDFNKSIQINQHYPLPYVNRAIAKVNLTEMVNISTYFIRGTIKDQPLAINWNMPNSSSLQKFETNFKSALSDCDTAIAIDDQLGFAYYIRGQIKQILKYTDACFDLLKAQELGLMVEEELLIDCRNN